MLARRTLVTGVLGALVAGTGLSSAAARPAGVAPTAPVITVAAGPSTETPFAPQCNDVVMIVDEATSFVMTRTEPLTESVTVGYSVQSNGQAGVNYVARPGAIHIAAGEATATVPIQPLDEGQSDLLIDMTLVVEPGTGYAVGDPSSAEITFASQRDPDLGPLDCNPDFQLLDVPDNTAQTIPVGSVPDPLRFTPVHFATTDVVAGELPPGITLPGEHRGADDGLIDRAGFSGAATTTGVFTATIRICPIDIVFTCRETRLTITVVPAPVTPTLPATGADPRDGGVPLAGAGLVLAGVLAVLASEVSRRRLHNGGCPEHVDLGEGRCQHLNPDR